MGIFRYFSSLKIKQTRASTKRGEKHEFKLIIIFFKDEIHIFFLNKLRRSKVKRANFLNIFLVFLYFEWFCRCALRKTSDKKCVFLLFGSSFAERDFGGNTSTFHAILSCSLWL